MLCADRPALSARPPLRLCRGGSAVALGFVIFILGWIIQSTIAFGFPYTPGARQSSKICFSGAVLQQWWRKERCVVLRV